MKNIRICTKEGIKMGKNRYVWAVLILISVGIIITFVFPSDPSEYVGESGVVNSHIEKDDTTSKKIKNEKQILSNTDPLNTMPDYIDEGEQCYEVDDVIERGDCFVDVHSNYFLWTVDTSKETFYYSFHHDQSHWKEVFYFEIEDDDELSEVIHTEDYDMYEDKYASRYVTESADERGINTVNEYWYVFSSLIPEEAREMLTEISWYDTGEDALLAVGVAGDDGTEASLLISDNVGNYGPSLKKTLIHEFAHMFTLDDTQMEIDADLVYSEDEEQWERAADECSTMFVNPGCLIENSYLYVFYEEFWEDVSDEYEAIDWEDERSYEEFFFDHEERFYNSYQGTSVVEDIADSFSFFVMQPSEVAFDAEEIKDEKLAFFYEYDELVDVRTVILENLFELNKKDEQFY